MDGYSVIESPSDTNEPVSITEFFIKLFPYYMAMGMTYDEYWNGPAWLVCAYREAYELRAKDEEWARWRLGAYIYDALLCAAPVMRASFSKGRVEPGKYPEEPWPLTEKEVREREEKHRIENYKRFVARLEKENKREEQKRIEEERNREEAKEDGDN